ncbi:hypothetical protein K8352_14360 [Flavobacteriaceae bacterium F89]|uniref:Uncharacterized protein n=1 Tax=Cerina litoralis TaxID=2874477 RepID=A0AAE3JQJ6_9FLAO|nr:hypothetical protein [Cerina litoralis]MCG2461939.1 hypothetical protein [Cerina litoralis]
MKTYPILFAVLFMGSYAAAQKPHKVKESIANEINSHPFLNNESAEGKPFNISKQDGLVRLYKFKNSRIKKALSFTTPRNRAKLV